MASSVNLGEKLEDVVNGLVKTGRFGSRSDVLREGVRLVQERESWLEMVEKAVERGRAQVAAGEWVDLEEGFDQLAARYADR